MYRRSTVVGHDNRASTAAGALVRGRIARVMAANRKLLFFGQKSSVSSKTNQVGPFRAAGGELFVKEDPTQDPAAWKSSPTPVGSNDPCGDGAAAVRRPSGQRGSSGGWELFIGNMLHTISPPVFTLPSESKQEKSKNISAVSKRNNLPRESGREGDENAASRPR